MFHLTAFPFERTDPKETCSLWRRGVGPRPTPTNHPICIRIGTFCGGTCGVNLLYGVGCVEALSVEVLASEHV